MSSAEVNDLLGWDSCLVNYAKIAIGCLALSRLFFDTYYFIRLIWCFAKNGAQYILFPSSRPSLLDESYITARCLSADLDHMGHMNNSRYNREADFGRQKLFISNGLYPSIYINKFSISLAATTIRFRRSINFLEKATLKTKIAYWDGRSVYIEQTFCRQSDSFVLATMYAQYIVVNGTFEELLEKHGYTGERPVLSDDLESWINYCQLNSKKLRPMKYE